MSIKILIIEDDIDLAQSLKTYLESDFAVSVATSGQKGLSKFAQESYNLVMLDLKLPDQTGQEVCQKIRQMEREVPIIVLTGVDDPELQITLLDAGADDYVTKPFDGRQLRARIDALLRRSGLISKSILKTHDLVIDTRHRHVTRAGTTLKLRRKEYDILEYLARNKGRAMPRTMIFDNVWDHKNWQRGSIDVHIKHLRDEVDRPFKQPLVETVHGIGYMLKDLPSK